MTKVRCKASSCIHNRKGVCHRKKIKLYFYENRKFGCNWFEPEETKKEPECRECAYLARDGVCSGCITVLCGWQSSSRYPPGDPHWDELSFGETWCVNPNVKKPEELSEDD